jgi:hypothetical protein
MISRGLPTSECHISLPKLLQEGAARCTQNTVDMGNSQRYRDGGGPRRMTQKSPQEIIFMSSSGLTTAIIYRLHRIATESTTSRL